MKLAYVEPTIEVKRYEISDVISASGEKTTEASNFQSVDDLVNDTDLSTTTEEPVAEESTTEAPAVEAPVVEESVVEEPVVEEPVVEEPAVEEIADPVMEEVTESVDQFIAE